MNWHGHRGAVSLTFDDGLPCQLRNALPELEKREISATFFLPLQLQQEGGYSAETHGGWDVAIKRGCHEIGSHSVRHLKAATLGPAVARYEAQCSKESLERLFCTKVDSFCYPYTDAIEVIQTAVRNAGYMQARGGRVARLDKFLVPGDGVNLLNVPCFHLGPNTIDCAIDWCREAEDRRAWFTLMIHGVGEPGTWDNIETSQFAELLGLLKSRDLWITTFVEAADCYRNAR